MLNNNKERKTSTQTCLSKSLKLLVDVWLKFELYTKFKVTTLSPQNIRYKVEIKCSYWVWESVRQILGSTWCQISLGGRTTCAAQGTIWCGLKGLHCLTSVSSLPCWRAFRERCFKELEWWGTGTSQSEAATEKRVISSPGPKECEAPTAPNGVGESTGVAVRLELQQ